MNTAIRVRLLLFSLLTVAGVLLAGVRYVGIPERYLGDSFVVSVNLPSSGGIFPNAEVTLRGIAIGRVDSLHLTPDGIRADLRIARGTEIPRSTKVRVANLSAVGEQYVDLEPSTAQGPFLRSGDALPVSAASTPPETTALLVNLDRLATSVGKDNLRTVITELGTAFDNSGQDLATTLTRAHQLSEDFTAVQPQTAHLLSTGRTVLQTQAALDPALQKLAANADSVTATLADQDPALRRLLKAAPGTLKDVRQVLAENQSSVAVLLGNLLTVNQILASPVRLRGINTELVLLPRIVQGTFNIQPGDGVARLGAVVDSSQRICTKGYESSGTPPTEPSEVSKIWGNPSLRANLNAYCAEPASAGVSVRGAANVPRPPGDDTARVIPHDNPRGFGPGSSFRNEQPAPGAGAANRADMLTPTDRSSVRVIAPTDLRGLLMPGGTA